MRLVFALAFALLVAGAGLSEPEPAPEAMAKAESDSAKSEATGPRTDSDTLYWRTPDGRGQYISGLKDVTCQACQGSIEFSGRLFVGRDVVLIKIRDKKTSDCFFSSGVECQGDGVELESEVRGISSKVPYVVVLEDIDLSLRFN